MKPCMYESDEINGVLNQLISKKISYNTAYQLIHNELLKMGGPKSNLESLKKNVTWTIMSMIAPINRLEALHKQIYST